MSAVTTPCTLTDEKAQLSILPASAAGVCQPLLNQVWEFSDDELEQHVQDCGYQMEQAYARFEATNDPHEREAAVLWMDLQHQAKLARSAALQARMKRVIDEGVDFFQTQGERDRRMLEARGLV